MFCDNELKERLLIDPAQRDGYKTLCVIAGYADPDMVNIHLEDWLQNQPPRGDQYPIHLNLLVGMFPDRDWHDNRRNRERYFSRLREFAEQMSSPIGYAKASLECRYVVEHPQIHTKLYIWLDDKGIPAKAFLGSPNYTKAGFGYIDRWGRYQRNQGEAATTDSDPDKCYNYFLTYWNRARPCTDPNIESLLTRAANSRP